MSAVATAIAASASAFSGARHRCTGSKLAFSSSDAYPGARDRPAPPGQQPTALCSAPDVPRYTLGDSPDRPLQLNFPPQWNFESILNLLLCFWKTINRQLLFWKKKTRKSKIGEWFYNIPSSPFLYFFLTLHILSATPPISSSLEFCLLFFLPSWL